MTDLSLMCRWLTQEPLCGGLACRRGPVNFRQAGEQSSGLAALTEASQDTSVDNNVRFAFFTSGKSILCLG